MVGYPHEWCELVDTYPLVADVHEKTSNRNGLEGASTEVPGAWRCAECHKAGLIACFVVEKGFFAH